MKLTDVVRHMCVCWHVQCRLFAADGSLMPTGAEGVSIPPEINIHSSVGHVLVLYKISCNTANVRAALHDEEAAIGHRAFGCCVLC
mgnify:CR=1 FL=1